MPDLACPNCGASASLPLGMTCGDHRPRPDCGHPNHGNPDHNCQPFLPPSKRAQFVLVRRADLATHMTKAPTVYPAWSDAHDRLRAALSADQTEDVAQRMFASNDYPKAPWEKLDASDREFWLDRARAVLGVTKEGASDG